MKPIIVADAAENTEERAVYAKLTTLPTPEKIVSENSPIFDFQSTEEREAIIFSGTMSNFSKNVVMVFIALGIPFITIFIHSINWGVTRQITRVTIPNKVKIEPKRQIGLRLLFNARPFAFGKK